MRLAYTEFGRNFACSSASFSARKAQKNEKSITQTGYPIRLNPLLLLLWLLCMRRLWKLRVKENK